MLIGFFLLISINYTVYTSTADIPNEITMGNHYVFMGRNRGFVKVKMKSKCCFDHFYLYDLCECLVLLQHEK